MKPYIILILINIIGHQLYSQGNNSSNQKKPRSPSPIDSSVVWEPVSIISEGKQVYNIIEKTKKDTSVQYYRTTKVKLEKKHIVVQDVKYMTVETSKEVILENRKKAFSPPETDSPRVNPISIAETFGATPSSIEINDNLQLTITVDKNDMDAFKYHQNPSNLYIAVNFLPMIVQDIVSVDTSSFMANEELDKRQHNKRAGLGYSFSFRAGYNMAFSHTIFLEFAFTQQNFISHYQNINWQNGFTEPATGDLNHRFTSNTIGLGYSYVTSQFRKIKFNAEAGIYYTLTSKYQVAEKNGNFRSVPIAENYLIKARIGTRLGIGTSIRLSSCCNLNILPSLLWDFTPVNRGQLKTQLYSFGLTTGVTFKFW